MSSLLPTSPSPPDCGPLPIAQNLTPRILAGSCLAGETSTLLLRRPDRTANLVLALLRAWWIQAEETGFRRASKARAARGSEQEDGTKEQGLSRPGTLEESRRTRHCKLRHQQFPTDLRERSCVSGSSSKKGKKRSYKVQHCERKRDQQQPLSTEERNQERTARCPPS